MSPLEVTPVIQPIYAASAGGPIRQGEIISTLKQYKRVVGTEQLDFDEITHPYAIVLTQDCDLDWDFRAQTDLSLNAKKIPNILFCEVMVASDLSSSLNNSRIWSRICLNKDERYQFLEAIPIGLDASHEGIGDLAIDFKRYFTLPTEEVYGQLAVLAKRRCCLVSPYLEHFCGRFWYFQNRIALPREHSASV